MVEEAGWNDIGDAKAIGESLQNNTPLNVKQAKAAQDFIKRLPADDQPALNNALDSVLHGKNK